MKRVVVTGEAEFTDRIFPDLPPTIFGESKYSLVNITQAKSFGHGPGRTFEADLIKRMRYFNKERAGTAT